MDDDELIKLRKQKAKAEQKDNLKELSTICNNLGAHLSQYGHYEEAIAEHETEKRLCEALNDRIGQAVATRNIGECYCNLGNFKKALKLQNQYLALAQECEDKVEIQRALAMLGDTYYKHAEVEESVLARRQLLDAAEEKICQSLRVCGELESSAKLSEKDLAAMRGRLMLNLGLVCDLRNKPKDSSEYLEKALNIAKKWNLENEQYLCHYNIATQALRKGNSALAQTSLRQALSLASRHDDKPRQIEVLFHLALASFGAEDVQAAKHLLKKAYVILPCEERDKAVQLYKAACSIETSREKLASCHEDEGAAFHLHEMLADAYFDVGFYSGNYGSAIEHYKKMVECGERQGLNTEKLIPAYISLAQAYANNGQLDSAIGCYNKEIELRKSDHSQICRSLLNIAELEEKRGDDYKSISKTLLSAFTEAKKANHPKLQVRVLKYLLAVQKTFREGKHQAQTEAKLRQVQEKYGVRSDDSLSEAEDEVAENDHGDKDDDDDLQTLSIADLTESEKSDEENVQPAVSQKVCTSRIQRCTRFKKNIKGETPLHVACIQGNAHRVKMLLKMGHPVHVRDHSGWTPLHEAANYNFPEIVELLIDSGAKINDQGGNHCLGLTPMIDAADNGNMATIKTLILKGANVLPKDVNGRNALQALNDWFKLHRSDLGQDMISEYYSVRQLLQDKMGLCEDVSRVSLNRDARPLPSAATSQSLSVESHRISTSSLAGTSHIENSGLPRRGSESSEGDSESENIYRNPALEDLGASSQSATTLYRQSIMSVRSSAQLASSLAQAFSSHSSKTGHSTPVPALISEADYVGDDWLVNDVEIPSSSRKRRDLKGLLSSNSIRSSWQQKRARLSTRRGVDHADDDSRNRKGVTHTRRLAARRRKPDSPVFGTSDSSMEQEAATPGQVDFGSNSEDLLPVLACKQKLPINQPVQSVEGSDFSSLDSTTSQEAFDRLVHRTPADKQGYAGKTRGLSLGAEFLAQHPDIFKCGDVEEHAVDSSAFHQHSGSGNPNRLSDGAQRLEGDRRSGTDISSFPMTTGACRQVSPAASVATSRLSRVKVRIEGAMFLIPIPALEEKTIRWLCDEAGLRYCSHFGRKPFLTLSSADGAILSAEDVLSAVLSQDEPLEGSVLGWDQPSPCDQYKEACKSLGTVCYRNLWGLLREAETSQHLSLQGLGLRGSVLLPVTRALVGCSTLQQLLLPDNRIGDGGMQLLVTALKDLKALTHLDLAGNSFTAVGLECLASLFPKDSNGSAISASLPLQLLTSINLSHNPLGSSITPGLCQLLRGLPSLASLSLSSCHLTAKLFQLQRQALASILKESSIQHLDLSYNSLGTLGMELLLTCLNPRRVTDLDLGHTRCEPDQGHLAIHLRSYISQGCLLKNLSLENCSLDEDDIDLLCSLPEDLLGLTKLNISVNKAVTTRTMHDILLRSAQCSSRLQHLQAEACSVNCPLTLDSLPTVVLANLSASSPVQISPVTVCPARSATVSFLEALRHKMASPYPLSYLALTCHELDDGKWEEMKELWMQRWGPASKVLVKENTIVMSASN